MIAPTHLKEGLKIISVPLILLAIYLSMMVLWRALGLPSDDALIDIVRAFFATYGLAVVFIGALLEGFLLLGQYFPGGTIIFLGVISAGDDVMRATLVVATVSFAFILSYAANYLVGKYGWYRLLLKFGLRTGLEKAQQKLSNQGLNAVLSSYWEPNLASLTATAAGILQIPLKTFMGFSVLGVVVWNLFWGTIVFLLGPEALKLIGFKFIIFIFLGWAAIMLLKHYLFDRRRP